jgi:hypothetical protein
MVAGSPASSAAARSRRLASKTSGAASLSPAAILASASFLRSSEEAPSRGAAAFILRASSLTPMPTPSHWTRRPARPCARRRETSPVQASLPEATGARRGGGGLFREAKPWGARRAYAEAPPPEAPSMTMFWNRLLMNSLE